MFAVGSAIAKRDRRHPRCLGLRHIAALPGHLTQDHWVGLGMMQQEMQKDPRLWVTPNNSNSSSPEVHNDGNHHGILDPHGENQRVTCVGC